MIEKMEPNIFYNAQGSYGGGGRRFRESIPPKQKDALYKQLHKG